MIIIIEHNIGKANSQGGGGVNSKGAKAPLTPLKQLSPDVYTRHVVKYIDTYLLKYFAKIHTMLTMCIYNMQE